MSPIEAIRKQVEEVRRQHVTLPEEFEVEGPLCSHERCAFIWPCPTLLLAEKMLNLAEWVEVEKQRHSQSGPKGRCLACGTDGHCLSFLTAERVLAEVAEEAK